MASVSATCSEVSMPFSATAIAKAPSCSLPRLPSGHASDQKGDLGLIQGLTQALCF